MVPEIVRFFRKVEVTETCWIWRGARSSTGYGTFSLQQTRRTALAHRYAYESAVGAVDAGLELDHLCRNRACVNPAHLEPVPHRTNTMRGDLHNRRKTHCPKGHEYTPQNTRTYRDKRYCRACHSAYTLAKYHERRAAGVAR